MSVDLSVTVGNKLLLVDVSISHPTAPSHVAKSAVNALAVADAAAARKVAKYRAMAAAQGAEFVPFACESFGGMAKQAAEFMQRMVKLSKDQQHLWQPREVVYGLERAVALAIQRGNGLTVSQG